MLYEHRSKRPIPPHAFALRMARHAALALAVTLVSLAIGMTGYMHYEAMAWRDAFVNAAMLLGGMGPVNAPLTDGGKVFAGLYALYAGIVFLLVGGVILAPVLHRLLHHLHWEEKTGSNDE